MKDKTSKQIVQDIHKKVEGLTHDIKTLEGFAKELLKLRLEIDSIRSSLRNYTKFTGCNYKGCDSVHECSADKVIQLIKDM